MTETMNPTALFQHYVQNIFKFPKEIKHDIVYCQRALKAHIKVHQMVLDVYKSQGNSNPVEKQRVSDELETQIYEINAEQQFLLLRLRRHISEFHKSLERKGIHVIPNLINETVSSELVPLINDQTFLVYPISVRLRCSEEQLIEKYFEVKDNDTQNNYFEILDSDEEEELQKKDDITMLDCQKPQRKASYKPILNNSNDDYESQQTSLLKPLEQRSFETSKKPNTFGSQFVEVNSEHTEGVSSITPNMTISTINKKRETTKTDSIYPVGISSSISTVEQEQNDLLVSQNVKMSRLNLRQVLKNAQSGKISANVVSKVPIQNEISSESKEFNTAKKVDQNNRNVNNNRNVVTSVTVGSSSDDSTPERCLAPIQQTCSQFPSENVETRLTPEDYGQEMFLRIFGLFTPEMHLQMQQRRSKRKRRTVQSNERSDYHYGHIEYGCKNPTDEKKKRKAFLLSPQIKRKQGRPPKRRSVEKSDDTGTSRSGTSSPDDKQSCIECLKVGGTLERCDSCRYYYHQYCHTAANKSNYSNKAKSCPPCRRLAKNETQQYQTLQNSADQYKQRLTVEKTRRKTLQQKSQSFKTQMNALFNIIKAMKKDAQSNLA